MLKVLLIYYEPQSSGQTTHVLSLARGLAKEKYKITVVLPEHLQYRINAFDRSGVKTEPLPMGKILWNPKSIISLMRLIRREEIDIVHVHSQEAGLIVRVVTRIAGTEAIVYTPQCTNISNERWFWLYRLIEKLLSFITDVIISVNEADRLKIIRWGIPSSKVITIHNGINLDLFSESSDLSGMKRNLGLDEKKPIVMQVGRLTDQKDPLTFIKGASLVAHDHPEVQFVLIGDGPLKNEVIASIKELGLNDQLLRLGWHDNGYKLIAMADIFSLTSRWEGLPYVLLEAMAWSRPVVATAVNGCPEVVRDGINGYLVPVNDPTSWAESVIKLLENPERAVDMGRRGKELLKGELSLKKMVEQTERLYDGLILNQPTT